MPATFKEQQELLTKTQHELAVWEALYKFLDENFIAHDGGNAKKGIAVQDCLVQIVPEDVLENILKNISEDKIVPLRDVIKSINDQEVVVMSKGDN